MIKLAFCGDDCSFCPRYNATLNQDEHKLEEIAVLWKTIGWRKNIDPPETLVCYGCNTFKGTCEYNVRECCIEKNIENCGKCESYPCDKIANAFEITRNNVEKYKDILSKEDYESFVKAFFSKKDNLDKVNPVRNSSEELNPAGIIIKPNPAAEQRGIISNGVNCEFKNKKE